MPRRIWSILAIVVAASAAFLPPVTCASDSCCRGLLLGMPGSDSDDCCEDGAGACCDPIPQLADAKLTSPQASPALSVAGAIRVADLVALPAPCRVTDRRHSRALLALWRF